MEKNQTILVCAVGKQNEHDIYSVFPEYAYLDLAQGHHDGEELMDLYETIDPSLCDSMRTAIEAIGPDIIITLGRNDEYLWNGTVVCRLFGQFSSWRDQWECATGATQIMIGTKPVSLYAIEHISDWRELS